MPDPSSAAIHTAMLDQHLRNRIAALGALYPAQIPEPSSWASQHAYKLAVAPVDETGTNTVASVFDYARQQYKPFVLNSIEPGIDPAAVTDVQLRYAIEYVIGEVTPSS